MLDLSGLHVLPYTHIFVFLLALFYELLVSLKHTIFEEIVGYPFIFIICLLVLIDIHVIALYV